MRFTHKEVSKESTYNTYYLILERVNTSYIVNLFLCIYVCTLTHAVSGDLKLTFSCVSSYIDKE